MKTKRHQGTSKYTLHESNYTVLAHFGLQKEFKPSEYKGKKLKTMLVLLDNLSVKTLNDMSASQNIKKKLDYFDKACKIHYCMKYLTMARIMAD